MSIEEVAAVGGGFVVIGGAIVAVVRWLDKGKLVEQIIAVENKLKEAFVEIDNIKVDLKQNEKRDQELRETVIKMEASHDTLNKNMAEMKTMLEKIFEKLDKREDKLSELSRDIAVLKEKTA